MSACTLADVPSELQVFPVAGRHGIASGLASAPLVFASLPSVPGLASLPLLMLSSPHPQRPIDASTTQRTSLMRASERRNPRIVTDGAASGRSTLLRVAGRLYQDTI